MDMDEEFIKKLCICMELIIEYCQYYSCSFKEALELIERELKECKYEKED